MLKFNFFVIIVARMGEIMKKILGNLKYSWGFLGISFVMILISLKDLFSNSEIMILSKELIVVVLSGILVEVLLRRVLQFYLEKFVEKGAFVVIFIALVCGLVVFVGNVLNGYEVTTYEIAFVISSQLFLGAIYYRGHQIGYNIVLHTIMTIADFLANLLWKGALTPWTIMGNFLLTVYFFLTSLYLLRGELVPPRWNFRWIEVFYFLVSIGAPIILFMVI